MAAAATVAMLGECRRDHEHGNHQERTKGSAHQLAAGFQVAASRIDQR